MVLGPIWLMQPIPYFGEKLDGEWIYEPKIDGWRMQVVSYDNGKIELWGRRLERKPNWSDKLRYLIKKLDSIIPPGTILDCELHSSGGRRFIPSLFAINPKVRPVVYVFDIMCFKGKDISKNTLRRRKGLLGKIDFKRPCYRVLGKKLTNMKRNYVSEVKKGHEGIVIKKLNSPYLIGKESPIATHWWRKIK
jgi:ATP-dependent DNA ligase